MSDLRVGDSVLWRGGWGSEMEKLAKVKAIQVNSSNGSKYGEDVQSVGWDTVVERKVIVDLDVASGIDDVGQLSHWAWGNQIRPTKVVA